MLSLNCISSLNVSEMFVSGVSAYIPPPALDESWCPWCGDLTQRPTNVRWQFSLMISYFRIFCMDKCMFCVQMSPTNLDYKNILISDSMKMIKESQKTDGIERRKQHKLGPRSRNLPKNLCPGGRDLTALKTYPGGCPGGT